ncbi:phospholipase A-2-activating protein [Thraustotheca clavata]|uniref:Phospholipase A-2-activating protein n=1 Tax=Thraustotheca clavata TaxID=74557 RepID=A0A1V9ZZ88_9STRA|nr:phospholipase A-2-activating protein [Thraustotheca clavata]
MTSEYNVQRALHGHGGAIRAICQVDDFLITGSMDAAIYVWNSSSAIVQSIFDHNHWVTALIPLSSVHAKRLGASGFVSGSMDTRLRVYLKTSNEFTCAMVLEGHSSGVISLAWLADSVLLSGSWDGTCRGWDLQTGICNFVLPNHENGVCVLGLSNDTVITGSTGRQEGNQVVDAVIRVWQPSNGVYAVKSTLNEHQGPIRQLVQVPEIGFASCSNDGSIKLWTTHGDVVMSCSHPFNHEGKPGFVLGLTYLPNTQQLVSASEDCSVRIWSLDGSCLQTISHPQGLWCAAALGNGVDFATGGDDKVARVFSTQATMETSAAEIISFQEEVAAAATARQRGPSSVDIAKLPDYNHRGAKVGPSDGFIQMFRKGNSAWACQWSGPSQTWLDIGEVTGTGSGGIVDGKSFDIVIPVEIETPNGLQKLEIGYNQGQNPFQVAQAFIDKHFLQQHYLKQIADFITQQSGSYHAPVLGETSTTSSSAPLPFLSTYFPVKTYASFDSTKVAKLHSTVVQFNSAVPPNAALSNAELETLTSLITTLTQTSFYHSSQVSSTEVNVVLKMVELWPAANVFPALDLCRLLGLHPIGAQVLSAKASWLLERCVAFGSSISADVPNPTRMLAWRVLVNYCVHSCLRATLVASPSVDSGLLQAANGAKGNKTLAVSIATLILNLSTAIFNNEQQTTDALIQVIHSMLPQPLDEDTFSRLILSIGTLGLASSQLWSKLPTLNAIKERASAVNSSATIFAIIDDIAKASKQ